MHTILELYPLFELINKNMKNKELLRSADYKKKIEFLKRIPEKKE